MTAERSERERLLARARSGGGDRRPLESYGLRRLTAVFLESLSQSMSEAADRRICILPDSAGWQIQQPVEVTVRYLYDRITVSFEQDLLHELLGECPADSMLESFSGFLQRVARNVPSFRAGNLRIVSEQHFHQRLVPLYFRVQVNARAYPVRLEVDEDFIHRLQTSSHLVRMNGGELPPVETKWELSARRELDSYELLLRLSRNERIALSALIDGSCELRQAHGYSIPLRYGENFLMKK